MWLNKLLPSEVTMNLRPDQRSRSCPDNSLRGWICKRHCPLIKPLCEVEPSWNVMAHAQKPDFVFRRNGRVHLNRREASVQSATGSRGVRISGNNAGYTMFRGSGKGTGYPLHSPVSPSLPLSRVTLCHHISTEVYFPCAKTLKHRVLVVRDAWYQDQYNLRHLTRAHTQQSGRAIRRVS